MATDRDFGKYFHFDNDFWGQPLRCGFLDLYQIGEMCCEHGFVIEEHEQSVYEVTYIITGSCDAYVDDEKVRLTEGDVMVSSMGHTHSIVADAGDILRFTYIGFRFHEDACTGDIATLKENYDRVAYTVAKDRNDILLPFMRAMGEFYSKTAFSDALIRNYCEQIVILAIRDSIKKRELIPERKLTGGAVNAAVYSVIRYIEENLTEVDNIREMAAELGYNYTYLSHFFKDKTGITLQKYIAQKKIERARQMLRYGGLTSTQVAAELGYESVQSFSKAFRRVMGSTPTQYLEMEREREKTEEVTP